MHNTPITRRTVLLTSAGAAATTTLLSGCGVEESATQIPSGEMIANVADIPESGVLATKLSNGLEVLVSNVSGQVVVMSAICPHQGCVVVDDADSLVCPCHRSSFTREDGELTRGPAESGLPHIAVEVSADGSISVV